MSFTVLQKLLKFKKYPNFTIFEGGVSQKSAYVSTGLSCVLETLHNFTAPN